MNIDMRTAVLVTMLGVPMTLGSARAQEAKAEAPAPVTKDAAAAVGKWIADLGSDSFRTRLEAEEQLRKLGEAALPALRKATGNADDREIQWRARRLVRQIERGDTKGLQQRSPRDDAAAPRPPRADQGWPADDIHQRFERLFRDMEDQFGLDIPRAHFFQDDFFQDLEQQMQNGASQSQGMSLQIGPDGAVRVEVKETDADGKVQNKVYEAPDMDTFQQQYPGVLKRGGLGFGMKLWSDDEPFRHPLFQMQRGNALDPFGGVPQPSLQFARPVPDADVDAQVRSGERLGVAVRPELSGELREHLGLADGVGLMVQSVAPGSLAEDLGLAAGDIVVDIGGQSIGSPADVQKALGAIGAGATVEVKFLRKGAEQTATAKKPAAEAKAPAAKDEPKGLHPRSPDGAKVR